jgi:predicted nucleic acid-binding protein
MIVVADAGPLHYLLLIGAANILQPLYRRVLVPEAVAAELRHESAPGTVRAWIASPPQWFEIWPDPPADPALHSLDAGEHAAIVLALSVNADRLLIDEQAGRAEAERRRLPVTGTLGVLAEAHRAGLLDFERALAKLRQTNFYLSADLIASVRRALL